MPRGPAPKSPPEDPRLELVAFAGDRVLVFELPREGSLTIGRAEGNQVRIDNPSVSRKHAILHVGPSFAIEDLGGANGTQVRSDRDVVQNGQTQNLRRVVSARQEIVVGDSVLLGSTMIVVRRCAAAASGVHGDTPPPSGEPVARTAAMSSLYEQAARAARSGISVLLLGETGVGKEVLARFVHDRSTRASGPFMGLNCAALSDALLESELFGHEKGAFTGATQSRAGLLEAAGGGTVFLDEIGELPPATQVKLLRVLEDRHVTPVGSHRPIEIDVRFVSATNRDLESASATGKFRSDLYFRLAGISLTIPPLRERRSEIAGLAPIFAAMAARRMDRPAPTIAPEVLELLDGYAWPGNVRELRNVIERGVALASDVILPEHLPSQLLAGVAPQAATPAPAPERPAAGQAPDRWSDHMGQLKNQLVEVDRQRIVDALEQCAGNQTQAAELLGISRRTLVNRLGDYKLPRPRKRS